MKNKKRKKTAIHYLQLIFIVSSFFVLEPLLLDNLAYGQSQSLSQENNTQKTSQTDSNEKEKKLAEVSSMLGHLLSSDADASSAVRGVVASSIGNEFENWLKQYAVAKVQLSIDKNLSLQKSQLYLLFPLHEENNNLTFFQTNFHRTDDRNQMNLGLGYRWFTNNWMLGGNTFFDDDLSRGHARIGFGLEYSRDFFRLSANRYLRVTDWKTSPDLVDYDERPANGWDIRAKAWLPWLPQLGGKLVYEKYYGNEVALFSTSTRSKDPSAINIGAEYSPFPLLTFGLERKQASSSQFDNRFSVSVNYELGVPWALQIDPSQLQKVRSLLHNRYELVDRNNNIVLEYQKQALITIKMTKYITGYPGESKSLNIIVKSKYGTQNVTVTAPDDLMENGGVIDTTNYSVTLPQWSETGTNIYTITGSATDQKGNTSNTAETLVSMKEVTANQNNSTFTADRNLIFTNGSDHTTLKLAINNSSNKPDDVSLDDIDIKHSASYSSSISSLKRTNPGRYNLTLTAGSETEDITLTALIQSNVSLATSVKVSSTPNYDNSSIAVDNTVYQLGSDIAVTVVLKDSSGNPVIGLSSYLSSYATIPNATLKGSWTESSGTYQANYTTITQGESLKATLTFPIWSDSHSSNSYVITKIEDRSSISCDDMSYYLTQTDSSFSINMGDFYWYDNICIPDATYYNGKSVKIYTKADWSSTVTVTNGDPSSYTIGIHTPIRKIFFTSDGTKWNVQTSSDIN